ncbi:MAG: hypothetical protein ABSB69_20635 [Solirubrobacteraceae bacterium]
MQERTLASATLLLRTTSERAHYGSTHNRLCQTKGEALASPEL